MKKGGNYTRHWSQTMKNKEGKIVTVGGHNYAKNLAKKRKRK